MRTETYYYAFDDTQFEDREECEYYEKRYLTVPDGVTFFTHSLNTIRFDPENAYGWLQEVYYIAIKNDHWTQVSDWFGFLGQCAFDGNPIRGFQPSANTDVTILHYVPDEWINMTDELKDMQQKHDQIMYRVV